jgi:hypothetical protein
MPVSDMRRMVKYNSKAYFQQDFPDFAFDCFILPPPAGKRQPKRSNPIKSAVSWLVAKKQYLEALQAPAKNAGYVADQVARIVGTVNS